LRAQVIQTGPKFQDIIIDAGGRDSTALRAALILSDVLVVPFAPRSLDVWALADINNLIQEARAVRDGLRVIAMLNNADPQGHDNDDAAAAVADFPDMEYVATPIRRRKPIANAAGQGLSVLEYSPKDAKSIDEMTALVNAVFQ
jgi:chromosome partitioning protein